MSLQGEIYMYMTCVKCRDYNANVSHVCVQRQFHNENDQTDNYLLQKAA